MLALTFCGSSGLLATPSVVPTLPSVQRVGAPVCSLDADGVSSRRAMLRSAASAAALLGTAGASPAWAGYVTSLGIMPTAPKDAEKDDELLASKEVQNSLENLKGYKAAAASLKSKFSAQSNIPLIPLIRSEFDFSKVRNDLNALTMVFDESAQLTTDRLSRAILYDLTELENASRLKKGETQRTEKKIANVDKWFVKLDSDFNEFLKYFS